MLAKLPLGLLLSVSALFELAVAQSLPKLPVLPVGLLASVRKTQREGFTVQDDALSNAIAPSWPVRKIKVPISHFANDSRYAPHVEGTFDMRFFVDEQYWDREAGPVYILLAGETDGTARLPFLENGILPILAKPTNGLSIVLEHRYYGRSRVVESLSTDDLRFLTTEQSLADIAYFIEHLTLGNHTMISELPVIVYGGSYAGAQAAFMRKLYPDLVFGAIASSAVTMAVYNYFQYFDIIRQNAPPHCVDTIVASIELVDTLLLMNKPQVTRELKTVFGLPNVTDDRDFVNMLAAPLGYWQMKNWDLQADFFDDFCEDLRLSVDGEANLLDELSSIHGGVLKISAYARYIRTKLAPICSKEDQDACFSTHDADTLSRSSIKNTWRLWLWQCCTEWAYWMPAAPEGIPSMISRLITTDWIQSVCPLAFPAGKHTSLPYRPETHRINQWGNFSLAMDRLAFIDGSIDPWRSATPHSAEAHPRRDTNTRPFKLIENGVHHWDENGAENEPPAIQTIHAEEVAFVKSWLRDWKDGVRGR